MKSACRAAAAVPASGPFDKLRANESRPQPDMAQAGGTDPAKLPQALASVKAWVEQKL